MKEEIKLTYEDKYKHIENISYKLLENFEKIIQEELNLENENYLASEILEIIFSSLGYVTGSSFKCTIKAFNFDNKKLFSDFIKLTKVSIIKTMEKFLDIIEEKLIEELKNE